MTPGKTASIGGGLNAGLFTMTHGLALELSEKQIRVNCQEDVLQNWQSVAKDKQVLSLGWLRPNSG